MLMTQEVSVMPYPSITWQPKHLLFVGTSVLINIQTDNHSTFYSAFSNLHPQKVHDVWRQWWSTRSQKTDPSSKLFLYFIEY